METDNLPYYNLLHAIDLEKQAITNDVEIFRHAKQGVDLTVFYSFAAAIKIPNKLLANLLHVSSRTMSNNQQVKKRLEPVQGEHLLKLIALYNKGIELFGTVDEFNYWLNKPFWNTEEKPVDWLITPGGVDLVAQELDRSGYGYPV
ncbi:MAG: antitoxin Xre-like helix-turn-helix domain-containing protein [Mucilaginibacter sp.]|uniref:antitoxin Xre-like helix-turn-helix domain-containing protein n=1 Tax=Mucilaginibacter sp. TaxID=1882438 RepID=UPI0034E3CF9B